MGKVKAIKCDIKIDSHKIKCRLFELGLNQEYIAQKMGLNYTTLNLKLNNKRPIYFEEVVKLAIILELKTFTDFIEYFGLGFLNLSLIRENANDVSMEGA